MKTQEFLQHRAELKKKQDDFTKEIDVEYNVYLNVYLAANCPYKKEQVVLVGKGKRAKRMVIFAIDTEVWDSRIIMISIYGWYLNENNETDKWEGHGIRVTGVSNPTPIELDSNQTFINSKS